MLDHVGIVPVATFPELSSQLTSGEMVPLPQGVKLEKPKYFTGVIGTDAVNVFILQVE